VSPRKRDYAAEYAARRARAKAGGWTGYGQRRYRLERLDDDEVRRLAEQIGGPVEPERAGSLMSLEANRIVNPRDRDRLPADWRVRLLQAAGQM
jgi:hypothetical protein